MDELELIKKAKTDADSFEELYRIYEHLVYQIARNYFIMGADIDDIIQEGTIGLYKAVISFDENKQASFKTFASLCIKRQILSAIKSANTKKRKIMYQLFSKDEEKFYNLPSNKENPEESAISKENCNIIHDEIQTTLSIFEQTVLAYYIEGFSYMQISERMGVPIKSVDNALMRIRSKLSHFLSDIKN